VVGGVVVVLVVVVVGRRVVVVLGRVVVLRSTSVFDDTCWSGCVSEAQPITRHPAATGAAIQLHRDVRRGARRSVFAVGCIALSCFPPVVVRRLAGRAAGERSVNPARRPGEHRPTMRNGGAAVQGPRSLSP
jgi:hypothetical protein